MGRTISHSKRKTAVSMKGDLESNMAFYELLGETKAISFEIRSGL